jgi:hypothetical protein
MEMTLLIEDVLGGVRLGIRVGHAASFSAIA